MQSIIIRKNDEGKRVDKFIISTFKKIPHSMVYKMIRKKDIKVNKKRCEPSYRLCLDDEIEIFLHDNFLEPVYDKFDFVKAPAKIDVIYEDRNIILVNKQAGLIVHPDENYHFDSLISRVQHYLYKRGEYNPDLEHSFAPALVNRIDRNTCGMVIIAKNAEVLKILNDKMRAREISKYYKCVVNGVFKKKSDTLTAYLIKDEDKNQVHILNRRTNFSKTIITKYEVIEERNGLTLLNIELLTGRTHQIRAHLSYIGHPIIGDGKYGKNQVNKKYNYKYQALCSYKISFDFKSDAGILNYLQNKVYEVHNIPFLKNFYGKGRESNVFHF